MNLSNKKIGQVKRTGGSIRIDQNASSMLLGQEASRWFHFNVLQGSNDGK